MLGKVRGNVAATDRVDIRGEGSLTGDVAAARITIEDGAFFKGGIDIRKPEGKGAQATEFEAGRKAEPQARYQGTPSRHPSRMRWGRSVRRLVGLPCAVFSASPSSEFPPPPLPHSTPSPRFAISTPMGAPSLNRLRIQGWESDDPESTVSRGRRT